MQVSDWTTTATALATALGGVEGIKQLLRWWLNRRTEQRKTDADIDAVENENERKQVDWLETRLAQRDQKVDSLYSEVRKLESEKLELIYKLHELELRQKEAEMKRCDVRGCGKRQPPSDY